MHVCIELPSTTPAFSDLWLCVMKKAGFLFLRVLHEAQYV